jgi:hypothetical protein
MDGCLRSQGMCETLVPQSGLSHVQHATLQAMSSLSVEWRELPAATASTVFSISCMNLFVGLS